MPPKVTKQSARKRTTKKSRSVVDRIKPVSQVDGGCKFLVYGQGKTGKTRFACSFPKPLLLIGVAGYGTEKGTRSVSTIKGVEFVPLEESEEIEDLVELDKYASYVLDTAGGLQERIVNEYTKHKPSVNKDWRHVGKGDWSPINSRTMERLRSLLDLADFQGKHVVIIAHERAFSVEAESNDLLFPHVGAALTPAVSGWLDGAVDYIGQCFVREGTTTKKTKIGGKHIDRQVKTDKMEYCLRTGANPVYRTGFRVPIGRKLPDAIINPTYREILKLIK